MVNPCESCSIDEKIVCCGVNPETGEDELKALYDKHGDYLKDVYVCPSFDIGDGNCMVENSKPGICKDYLCGKFADYDVIDLMGE